MTRSVDCPEGRANRANSANSPTEDDGWEIIVPVPADAPPLTKDLITTLMAPGAELVGGSTHGRWDDNNVFSHFACVAHIATRDAQSRVSRSQLYVAFCRRGDAGAEWRIRSRDEIDLAAEQAGLVAAPQWPALFELPPPWRDGDDGAEREAIAALVPLDCDREAFLADVRKAAWEYSMAVEWRQMPSRQRETARTDLKRLARAAAGLKAAQAALGELAASTLLRVAHEASDEGAGGLVHYLSPPSIVVDGVELGNGDIRIDAIVCLAEELGSWATSAEARITKSKKGPNEAAHECVRELALALWRHTGKRSARAYNHYAAEGTAPDRTPLTDLVDRTMSPVDKWHGVVATTGKPSRRRGIINKVLQSLAADADTDV